MFTKLYIGIMLVLPHNLAWASRTVQYQVFRAPSPSVNKNDVPDGTLVAAYEFKVNLVNLSKVPQSGTIGVTSGPNQVWLTFTDLTSTGFTNLNPDSFSYLCGSRASAKSVTSNVQPSWPAPVEFAISPKGSIDLIGGVIFHIAKSSGVDKSNGVFSPMITIELNEDRGAVIGYAQAYNRCYGEGSPLCLTGPDLAKPLDCSWGLQLGTPREINGGRPF